MAYITTERFYEYLDFATDILEVNEAQGYVDRAFKRINNWSGTYHATTINDCATFSEVLDPTANKTTVASDTLVLSKYPVQQISTISVNNSSYATTEFNVYSDRISIATSATTISSFGTLDKNVNITYKYGVVNDDAYGAAQELNTVLAVLMFVQTPKGRNTYLDNSRFVEINQNNVRPNDVVDTFIQFLLSEVERLKTELGMAHEIF